MPILQSDLQPYIDANRSLFAIVRGDAGIEGAGKIPAHKGSWVEKACPVKVFNEAYWRNYEAAWALEPNVLVVDVDTKNGKRGAESLIKLEAEIGAKLSDLTNVVVQTGSGGFHYIFSKPEAFPIQKRIEEFPDIDFLGPSTSAGGACYVVTAGSLHQSGNRYRWVGSSTDLDMLSPAPIELLDRIVKRGAISKKSDAQGAFDDSDESCARAIAYLSNEAPFAVQGHNGNDTTFRVAARLHDYGISEERAASLMMEYYSPRCEPPWEMPEIKRIVGNAYRYCIQPAGNANPQLVFEATELAAKKSDLAKLSANGTLHCTDDNWIYQLEYEINRSTGLAVPKATLKNLDIMMRHHPMVANLIVFDTMSNDICFVRKAPWHLPNTAVGEAGLLWDWEGDTAGLRLWFVQNTGVDFNKNALVDVIYAVAKQNESHPVQNYLRGLEWDGVERIEKWLIDYCGADDTTYVRTVGAKWLCGGVARIMTPGSKFDTMLVLEGVQGQGKSSIGDKLADPWFTDNLGDLRNNNQAEENIKGKWIVEVAELHDMDRASVNRVKHFLSQRVDRYREKYARKARDFPRQCIFLGTTNHSTYLRDSTGNRRFWPVVCRFVDAAGISKVRDQLWAEAYARWHRGYTVYIDDPEVLKEAERVQDSKRERDPWEDLMLEYLELQPVNEYGHRQVKLTTIFSFVLHLSPSQRDNYVRRRVAMILIGLGYTELTEAGLFTKYIGEPDQVENNFNWG